MKRLFDIIASGCGLVVLSPLLLIIAIWIKCDSEGPVFYSHKRVGKNGKEIGILKFRSMVLNADKMIDDFTEEQKQEYKENYKLENDPRVTKIGHFIRKTSIDELPQLWNVLKGDMSIIGPRPPLPREVNLYTPRQMQRLLVKGGLSCYCQCNGRSNMPFEEICRLSIAASAAAVSSEGTQGIDADAVALLHSRVPMPNPLDC